MSESSRHGYLQETQTPVYSLILIAPFLLVYEVGLFLLRETIQNYPNMNGADKLIRHLLIRVLGLSGLFIGVVVLVAYFAVWQWRSKASMKFKASYALFGFFESTGWALALYILPWQLYRWLAGQTLAQGANGLQGGLFAEVVLSCGAGVYEEFLFRGLLVTALILALRSGAGLERDNAGLIAVIVGALLFSFAHHVGPLGDPVIVTNGQDWAFHPQFWPRFIFRSVAGVFFAALFFYRSFGVAVASHATYDILVFTLQPD